MSETDEPVGRPACRCGRVVQLRTVPQPARNLRGPRWTAAVPSRSPVVTNQYLNFNDCRLAAVLYGAEDDVDISSFGSRLPI